MAFTKNIVLNNGYTATYFRISTYAVDKESKFAEATLRIYKDKATSRTANSQPATNQVIKVRLEGAAYNRWFSKAAKDAAVVANLSIDDEAIFYRAARSEGVIADPEFGPKNADNPARRDVFAAGDVDLT